MIELRNFFFARSENLSEDRQCTPLFLAWIDARKQIALRPYDAMDGLTRGASDRTDGKAFRCLLGVAIVALAFALKRSGRRQLSSDTGTDLYDDLYLSVEASCPTFDQGNISRQAHLVDMPPRFKIV